MPILMVPREHAVRPEVERLIAEVYAQHYSASVAAYPNMLVAMIDSGHRPVCAAALRFVSDGFFSECYLDAPIQTVLSDRTRRPLRRDRIFEVTSLASRSPNLAAAFLRAIVSQGEQDGFEWAFFTAIERLKSLLERMRLPLFHLMAADPSRVPDLRMWGTYYDHSPQVYAVNRVNAGPWLQSRPVMLLHG